MNLEQLVRPGMLSLAREAVQRGIPVEEMCLHPTYNQRCYACGRHHGWACVCSREEKAAWGRREAMMQTPWFAGKWVANITNGYRANTPDTKSANKGDLQTLQTCSCGRALRPHGTDCWKCYRERKRG